MELYKELTKFRWPGFYVKENELDKKSNVQKMHITNSDKPVQFYSLDVIISVGYRVKSQRGVERSKDKMIPKSSLAEYYP